MSKGILSFSRGGTDQNGEGGILNGFPFEDDDSQGGIRIEEQIATGAHHSLLKEQ